MMHVTGVNRLQRPVKATIGKRSEGVATVKTPLFKGGQSDKVTVSPQDMPLLSTPFVPSAKWVEQLRKAMEGPYVGRYGFYYPRNRYNILTAPIHKAIENAGVKMTRFFNVEAKIPDKVVGNGPDFVPKMQEEIQYKLYGPLWNIYHFHGAVNPDVGVVAVSDGKSFTPEVIRRLSEGFPPVKSAAFPKLLSDLHDELVAHARQFPGELSVQEDKLVFASIRPELGTLEPLDRPNRKKVGGPFKLERMRGQDYLALGQTRLVTDPKTQEELLAHIQVGFVMTPPPAESVFRNGNVRTLEPQFQAMIQDHLEGPIQEALQKVLEKDIRQEVLFKEDGYRFIPRKFLGWQPQGKSTHWADALPIPTQKELGAIRVTSESGEEEHSVTLKHVSLHFIDSKGTFYGADL